MPFFKRKPFNFNSSRKSKLPQSEFPRINEDVEDYRSSDDRLSENTSNDNELAVMNAKIKMLEEEKNMILLKNELLLDMLSEAIQSLKSLEDQKSSDGDDSN